MVYVSGRGKGGILQEEEDTNVVVLKTARKWEAKGLCDGGL